MVWTDITRRDHNRKSDCYPSELTDREWALLTPLLPPSKPGGHRGQIQSVVATIGFYLTLMSLPMLQRAFSTRVFF